MGCLGPDVCGEVRGNLQRPGSKLCTAALEYGVFRKLQVAIGPG